MQDRDAITQLLGFGKVVRGQQDGTAHLRYKCVVNQPMQCTRRQGIQAPRRLIQQQNLRLAQQRPGDGQAMPHPRRVDTELPIQGLQAELPP